MVDFKDPITGNNVLRTPQPTYLDPAEKLRLENAAAAANANTAKAGSCATGGSSPGTPGSQDGTQNGHDDTPGVKEKQAGIRRAPIQPSLKDKLEKARVAAGIDRIDVFSGGQNDETGYTGSFRHNNGWAADVYLYKDGRRLDGNNAADRAIMSKFVTAGTQQGIRGWGWGNGYMGASGIHADVHGFGGNVGVWGEGGRSANAAPWMVESANAGAPEGQRFRGGGGGGGGGSPAGNSAAAGCGGGGGGSGCQPISAGAAGAASSMAAGQGLAAAAGMVGQLAALAQNPMALAQAGLQTALGAVAPQLGQAAALATSALANPVGALTQTAAGLVQNLGAGSVLSSLTGVIPAAFSGGGLQGLLSTNITSIAGSIIQQGVPQLGSFAGILNSAVGAAASGGDLANVLNGSVSQVFGRAVDGALTNGTFPGLNLNDPKYTNTGPSPETDYTEGVEGMDLLTQSVLLPKLDSMVWFPGDINQTLERMVEQPNFDAFTSLYMDYNSMVTQGYGQLTDNLIALGRDLQKLGDMGDMADLLNIGTPKQLVRQLIEHGLGVSTGILDQLAELGLDIETLYDETSTQDLWSVLEFPLEQDVLDEVMTVMQMDLTLNIKSLADLLTPEKIFGESFQYNRFLELRDMALTLAMCNDGVGNIKNLYELGLLFSSMETAESFQALNAEYAPLRLDELDALKAATPVDSYFGNEGPVLADFIGTAAGYVHADTLPKMVRILDEIESLPELDDLDSLQSLLTDTLDGVYTVGATITVPTTAGYVFGTYSTLDDAAIDIVTSIEYELEFIWQTADPDLLDKLLTLQGLHDASASFLYHEQIMRQAYGVDIGESRGSNNYVGDGTTVAFKLTGLRPSNIQVYDNGELQNKYGNWSYNSTTKTVTFTSAPGAGRTISISYDTESTTSPSTPAEIWQLASNLESYALQTGFGGPADFLSRVATNDRHGQRIKAVMIQARNKARLDNIGIGCSGYNRVLNENGDDHSLNFIEKTGIWSKDADKAAEIWLRNTAEVETIREYWLQEYKRNRGKMRPDVEMLMHNVIRQLLFVVEGQVIASDRLIDIYNGSSTEGLFAMDDMRYALTYLEDFPDSGMIIGPFDQITSKIIGYEGMKNTALNLDLDQTSKDYLKKIGMDLEYLVSVCQKIMLTTLARYYSLKEEEVVEVFGVQSVSKSLLNNVANSL